MINISYETTPELGETLLNLRSVYQRYFALFHGPNYIKKKTKKGEIFVLFCASDEALSK